MAAELLVKTHGIVCCIQPGDVTAMIPGILFTCVKQPATDAATMTSGRIELRPCRSVLGTKPKSEGPSRDARFTSDIGHADLLRAFGA